MVRKIIEKFNDLKIEKFATETAELEFGDLEIWKFENVVMMTLGMEFGPEPSGWIFFALPRMHEWFFVFNFFEANS